MPRSPSPAPANNAARKPCVGLLELSSIARGVQAADAVLWQAEIEILFCEPASPGKFVILFSGEVESVSQSLRRGMEVAGSDLTDQIIIPNLDPIIYDALCGRFAQAPLDAIGIIETSTVASTILSADIAIKTAIVNPVELRLANQIGGKAFVTFVGEVGDVRTAVGAGASSAREKGTLVNEIVISGPHPMLAKYLRAK
ncbi:MAG: BMC domain-containing protein [Planctomycetes bacterium]|nr:BMC domain-containing protein [Planctomycetota bacterium]